MSLKDIYRDSDSVSDELRNRHFEKLSSIYRETTEKEFENLDFLWMSSDIDEFLLVSTKCKQGDAEAMIEAVAIDSLETCENSFLRDLHEMSQGDAVSLLYSSSPRLAKCYARAWVQGSAEQGFLVPPGMALVEEKEEKPREKKAAKKGIFGRLRNVIKALKGEDDG